MACPPRARALGNRLLARGGWAYRSGIERVTRDARRARGGRAPQTAAGLGLRQLTPCRPRWRCGWASAGGPGRLVLARRARVGYGRGITTVADLLGAPARRGCAGVRAGCPSDGVSALAQREIPPPVSGLYRGSRRDAMAWTGRSSRGSARSSATTGATPIRRAPGGRRQLGGRRRADAVPRLDVGSVRRGRDGDGRPTAGTLRMRSSAPPTTCARRALRAITAGDLAYNHAEWYVVEVETWAARYSGPGGRLHHAARGAEAEAKARKAPTGRA
jgi:hypothetical protein